MIAVLDKYFKNPGKDPGNSITNRLYLHLLLKVSFDANGSLSYQNESKN